jgi:hypothetical protein
MGKVQLEIDRNINPSCRPTPHDTPVTPRSNTPIWTDSISDQVHQSRDCYALNTRPARVDRLEKSPINLNAHTERIP